MRGSAPDKAAFMARFGALADEAGGVVASYMAAFHAGGRHDEDPALDARVTEVGRLDARRGEGVRAAQVHPRPCSRVFRALYLRPKQHRPPPPGRRPNLPPRRRCPLHPSQLTLDMEGPLMGLLFFHGKTAMEVFTTRMDTGEAGGICPQEVRRAPPAAAPRRGAAGTVLLAAWGQAHTA